ncbi:hypothetical protein ACLI4Z_18035 [Natrialbaceae archaeon A-arb3/5]
MSFNRTLATLGLLTLTLAVLGFGVFMIGAAAVDTEQTTWDHNATVDNETDNVTATVHFATDGATVDLEADLVDEDNEIVDSFETTLEGDENESDTWQHEPNADDGEELEYQITVTADDGDVDDVDFDTNPSGALFPPIYDDGVTGTTIGVALFVLALGLLAVRDDGNGGYNR